ncbi:CAP domain-containing protein [Paenibacillus lentus]|uniref:SCP-like extracellular n=1 Tax=Paenibacillus lentus TaxID=1338368 RepID=A0A3S8RYX2_9BACL|nr:CAP domain-containing protein [Paenibacillus lentus]AZK48131.1 SCP-like extracellular [Paenibacillus lentus]
MKNKQLKSIITGSMATAVLAAGLILPSGAKAEAASIPTSDWQKQVQQIWLKWSWNGSFNHIKWYIPSVPAPETTTVPNQKPSTPSQQPTAPSQKPTTPSKKPATGNGTTTAPTAPSKNNHSTNGQTEAASFAAQVVDLVNKERAKAGLKPLATQADLANMAAVKAADMRKNGYFDHQSPTYGSPFDMMKQFGITYKYAGENIAKGQRSPAEVMNAWMNSEGHRKNIMSANFTNIGVAYDNGYWVQVFIGK